MLAVDRVFAAQVEEMLNIDFSNCRLVKKQELEGRSFWFKLATRVARLLAPVQ